MFPNLPVTGARIGRYIDASHFSDGLFSEVFRAADADRPDASGNPTVVALKVTTPALMTPPHDAIREARILAAAKGSTIVPLIETFHQTDGHYVLVFPFLPFDLATLLRQNRLPTEDDVRRGILRDLFTGLAHLHNLKILHRDIKPGNILLASPRGPARIADFGIAWAATANNSSEPADCKILDVGTTSYRAPELLFGNTAYGPGVDLWAAGCVAAQTVSGGLGAASLFDAGDLGSELALIRSIFTTLGTPDDEGRAWPETQVPGVLPDWGKMRFTVYSPRPWVETLPNATEEGRDLVSKLVTYESGWRLSAEQVSATVQRFFEANYREALVVVSISMHLHQSP